MIRMLKLMLALVLAGACAQAPAQAYPVKPIRLAVGFAPRGAADYVARAVGEALGRVLGQSIVTETGLNGRQEIGGMQSAIPCAEPLCRPRPALARGH